jgi:hypothetical protein
MARKDKRGAQEPGDQSLINLEIEMRRSSEYQRQVKDLEEKLANRKAEVDNARNRIIELERELESANGRVAAAGGILEQRAGEWERLREAQVGLADREQKIAERELRVQDLVRQCEEYEHRLVALRVEHAALQQEAAAAKRSVVESRRVFDDEMVRLGKWEQALLALQAAIDDRVQRAALKEVEADERTRQAAAREAVTREQEQRVAEAQRHAQAELLRADAARIDREQRERELVAREQAAALADAERKRRQASVTEAEEELRRRRDALAAEQARHRTERETLRVERAAFEHERAVWAAEAEARARQAEADEWAARVAARAESERRCKELEARAKEQYDAHLELAFERARDLEEAARKTHDQLIAKASDEDRRRRETFEHERADREATTAAEAERRLKRAAEEAAKIDADAANARAEIERRRSELERLVSETRAREQALETERQELAVLRETLDNRRKRLQQHIDEEAEARVGNVRAELVAESARGETLQRMLRAEAEKRTELDALITGSGGETVPRLKQQLDEARGRVAALEQRLRDVPHGEDIQRLRERADAAEAIERQRAALQLRVNQLNDRLASAESERVQRDGEHRIAETLRATNQALKQELDHLKALVDQQVANPLRAFAEVHAHVEPPRGQTTRPRSLCDLAIRARHRMAALPEGRARFYDQRVVATTLASLAASRTLLLEGKSGTGKTSLLVALAEAIGATCEVIEVQSQWRDRGDLVGSYNPFHKRFYAAPFALALYRAGLPGFRERPFFVILDELNLSHVEHYFADVLSLLERDPREHRLRLVEDPEALERAPFTEGLVKDNRYGWSLGIPPNVWFVGTANRDESTRPISDKVYDRAAIIELNQRAQPFEAEPQFELLDAVGFEDLVELFRGTPAVPADDLKPVTECLDLIAGDLEERFRITRTNRFDNQWKRFLPVYLAAHPANAEPGGRGRRLGEAMDHFLATKLLRSLKERFDPNLEDMLLELRDKTLPACWEDLWGPFKGSQSHDLLSTQLRSRCGR